MMPIEYTVQVYLHLRMTSLTQILLSMHECNEKIKKFRSFVKSLKKDALGMAYLRENGILAINENANICNRQFQVASTYEAVFDLPWRLVQFFLYIHLSVTSHINCIVPDRRCLSHGMPLSSHDDVALFE